MTSIVLSAVGTSVGGSLASSFGAQVGKLAGSFAGRMVDQKLFGGTHASNSTGAHLKDLSVQSAAYGSMIPILYGNTRIAGNIIWAKPIKETPHTLTTSGGAKGAKVKRTHTQFTYSTSIAVSVCEGEVQDITRIWANDQLLDTTQYNIRIYKGSENQLPDPMIEAELGIDKTPAYRGTAYVVFEDFPLSEFANHIPNFTFEVKRNVICENEERVEDMIESVVIIPGSGEFVYDTVKQTKIEGNDAGGKWSQRGFQQSINQHNLSNKTNSLVSLDQLADTLPNVKWTAPVVTWFGASLDAKECVIKPGVEFASDAITTPDIWKVGSYSRSSAHQITKIHNKPIYGGTTNDASILRYLDELEERGYKKMFYPMFFMDTEGKPWRGRVSGSTTAIRKFFTKKNGYNEFILHYAKLVKDKVDAFVIGSEMIGLTKIKDKKNKFPAVEELIKLAAKVKKILGPDVIVTYAADWSEYHHAEGGWYNLDPLWASPDIDVIGIDAYFPLTDEPQSGYNLDKTISGWESGEGYDFYYTDDARKIKKPIEEKYAWKNITWWWGNSHINPDGKKTAWKPKSKKIWFTEYGFPSVDGATNQPNVFHDPTSSESHFPRHSGGNVDYRAQRIGLHATEKKWQNSEMVERKFVWTWDARPFPFWPDFNHVWSDGAVWSTGHWIQGKLGLSSLGAIVSDLANRSGLCNQDFSANKLTNIVDGFVVGNQTSARKIIEGLQNGYFFDSVETDKTIHFTPRENKESSTILSDDLVPMENETINIKRIQEVELPQKVDINFINRTREFQIGNQHASRQSTSSEQKVSLDLPIVMNNTIAASIAEVTLYNIWMERNRYSFALPPKYAYLSPTDLAELELEGAKHLIRITDTHFGKNGVVKVEGVAEDVSVYDFRKSNLDLSDDTNLEALAKTHIEILDLPALPNDTHMYQGYVLIAATGLSKNWTGTVLYASTHENSNFEPVTEVRSQATIGTTVDKLEVDSKLKVNLISGELQSVTEDEIKAGANMAVIGNEIVQFQNAELIDENQYELSEFVRGCQSTEHEIDNHQQGDRFVLLNDALEKIELPNSVIGNQHFIKPVTIRDTIGNTEISNFTYQANSLKPFAPIDLKAEQNENEYQLSWIRRTRINSHVGNDSPLYEEFEKYIVEVVKGDEVIEEIETNKPSLTYNSSEKELSFRVSQVSAIVGKGFSTILSSSATP